MPSCMNFGIFKDLMCYLVILNYVSDQKNDFNQYIKECLLYSTCLYIDSQSWPLLVGFIICADKKRSIPVQILIVLGTTLAFMQVMAIFGSTLEEQLINVVNIAALKDHSENIGMYFYISIQVFRQHTNFFLISYVVFSLVIVLQIMQLVRRGYAIIALCSQNNYDKYS